MALLEKLGYILPMCDEQGQKIAVEPGSISAGYQNFLVCIEMFFAAIALRYAFPISVYLSEGVINGSAGRSVTMQSISSSLKVRRSLISRKKSSTSNTLKILSTSAQYHFFVNPLCFLSLSEILLPNQISFGLNNSNIFVSDLPKLEGYLIDLEMMKKSHFFL